MCIFHAGVVRSRERPCGNWSRLTPTSFGIALPVMMLCGFCVCGILHDVRQTREDALGISQWRFWVIPSVVIDRECGLIQKKIRVSGIRSMKDEVAFPGLSGAIAATFAEVCAIARKAWSASCHANPGRSYLALPTRWCGPGDGIERTGPGVSCFWPMAPTPERR